MTLLRHTGRVLRRSPGFTAITVMILAFAIGANTALFTVVNGVLLRPLPYAGGDRLVSVHEVVPKFARLSPTIPVNAYHFKQWREHTQAFEGLALLDGVMLSLTGIGEPERVAGGRVSASLFPMLGIQPRLGRAFREDEDRAGQDRVVVISDSLWRRRFQASPDVLGRTLTLDAVPYEIIGVLPPDIPLPRASQVRPVGPHDLPPEIWKPFAIRDEELYPFGDWNYACIGRLKPGVSPAQGVAELNAVQASIAATAPVKMELRTALIPLQEQLVGKMRHGLWMLFLAVLAVLLISCANVANLVLVRANGRRREWAIRSALGAPSGHIVREAFAEGAMLAALGGIAGVLLAQFALDVLIARAPLDLPRLNEVSVDWRVLSFAFLLSAVAGIFFAILPAWRYSRVDAQEALKAGSHAVVGGGPGGRFRSLLVGIEVALGAACLITAGLLLQSFVRLMNIDRGFDSQRVITVALSLPELRYRERPQRARFVEQTLRRLQALPGVQGVAVASLLPLTGEGENNIITLEGTKVPVMERPIAEFRSANPDFFKTLGIPLQRGRVFTEADKGRNVVLLSAQSAARLFPGQDPLGKRFHLGDENRPLLETIGVVGDVRGGSLDKAPALTIYLPYWQRLGFEMFLAVRTGMDPVSISSAVRREIAQVDPEVPVPRFRTMEDVVAASVAERRFQLGLVLLFGVTAVLLAGVGIYSVVSYAMSQRTNEMGVRLALGAQRNEVLHLALRQGMAPVVAGLAVGVALALALGRFLQTLLFNVKAYDPLTITAVVLLFGAVGITACYIPARRAAVMDPLAALRYE